MTKYIFGAILFIGVILRFYNAPARYLSTMDNDQVRDVLIVYQAAKENYFSPVGAFSSLGSFVFGPWYYWQLILFQKIFPFTFSPWVYSGILSILGMVMLYFTGKEYKNTTLGLVMMLIAAISGTFVFPALNISNIIFVVPFSAAVLWFFALSINKRLRTGWWLLYGLIFGITVNLHYQALGLGVLLVFSVIGNFQFKKISLLVLGFILAFLPLLYFDAAHNWFNVRNIADYYLIAQYRTYFPNRWLTYIFEFWPNLLAYSIGADKILALLLFLGGLVLTLKKKSLNIFLLLSLLINFVVLRFYRGPRVVSYFNYLLPILFLILVTPLEMLISNHKTKFMGFFLTAVVLGFIIRSTSQELRFNQTFDLNVNALSLVNRLPTAKFRLFICGTKDKVEARKILFTLRYLEKLDPLGDRISFGSGSVDCMVNKPVSLGNTFFDIKEESENNWEEVSVKNTFEEGVKWWVGKAL